MKKLLGIMVLMVFPVIGFSQDKIDSLQREISSRSGIEKFEPMVELVRAWWQRDSLHLALKTVDVARAIAFKSGDTTRIVESCRILGIIYNRLSMYKEAEEILTWAIPVAKRHGMISKRSAMANSLGTAYGYQARYDDALKLHFENLAMGSERGDLSSVSMSLHNIGLIYYKLKDYQKGLAYFKEVVKVKRKNSDSYDLDLTLLNIAHCHAYMHQYDSARRWTAAALKACEGDCSKMRLREAEFVLGLADLGENKIHSAETHFLQSYLLAKEIDDVRFQFDNIDYLANIHITNRDFAKAEKFLQEAERIIEKGVSLNLEVIKMYKRFFELYKAVGNYKMASHFQQKYITLKDSLYDEELTNNLMKIEADYLERENKAKIRAQAEVLKLNEEIITRQYTTNVSLAAAGVMAVVVAVVLYRSNRQKHRINLILDRRVTSRTRELELKQTELLQTTRAREHTVHKTTSEMRALLSSISGLCFLAAKDECDPKTYSNQVQMMSDQLMLALNNIDNSDLQESSIPQESYPI